MSNIKKGKLDRVTYREFYILIFVLLSFIDFMRAALLHNSTALLKEKLLRRHPRAENSKLIEGSISLYSTPVYTPDHEKQIANTSAYDADNNSEATESSRDDAEDLDKDSTSLHSAHSYEAESPEIVSKRSHIWSKYGHTIFFLNYLVSNSFFPFFLDSKSPKSHNQLPQRQNLVDPYLKFFYITAAIAVKIYLLIQHQPIINEALVMETHPSSFLDLYQQQHAIYKKTIN